MSGCRIRGLVRNHSGKDSMASDRTHGTPLKVSGDSSIPRSKGISIRFIGEDIDLLMPVPLHADEHWRVSSQLSRLALERENSEYWNTFLHLFRLTLLPGVDNDLKPPTEAQLSYAVAIAKMRGVGIPAEAFSSRVEMSSFIDCHKSFPPPKEG